MTNPPCICCGKECQPAYEMDGSEMYRCVACNIYVGRDIATGCAVMVTPDSTFSPEKYPHMKELGEWAGIFGAGAPEPR